LTKTLTKDLQYKAIKLISQADLLEKQLKTETEELREFNKEIALYRESFLLARQCSKKFIDRINTIEELVSEGLSIVFDTPMKFYFEKVEDPGGSLKGLKPMIEQEDGHTEAPESGFGSSVVQITSTILRVCVLAILGTTKPILILDEPFSNVNIALRENLELFISQIAKDAGIQIITVTHMDSDAPVVYEVEKIGITSYVKRIK